MTYFTWIDLCNRCVELLRSYVFYVPVDQFDRLHSEYDGSGRFTWEYFYPSGAYVVVTVWRHS
jgi:hypothetical protein